MPQPPNARLAAPDLKTLDDWIAKGAPAATTCAAPDGGAPPPPPDAGPPDLSCTTDARIKPGTTWSMPSTSDDVYVCYGFDVTSATKRHVVGITADGRLWAWGNNDFGQLGLGSTGTARLRPTQVGTATNWVSVAAGTFHTVALKYDGSFWA